MLTLGIETSGRSGSVALSRDGDVLEERTLSATGRRHARTLVPEIQDLLAAHRLRPSDIPQVAVSQGPGSFTGLRVGLVCAKTWCYATQARLVGVDTFLAIAAGHAPVPQVWVIDDALRGDVFAGRYGYVAAKEEANSQGRWQHLGESKLMPFDAWASQLPADAKITGPGLRVFEEELKGYSLAPTASRNPSAALVALQGAQQIDLQGADDPWTLEPHYIRRSAAEENAEARAK